MLLKQTKIRSEYKFFYATRKQGLKMKIYSMRIVRFCPHENVNTYNYMRKEYGEHSKIIVRQKCGYQMLSITMKKRKRFRTNTKTNKSGKNVY